MPFLISSSDVLKSDAIFLSQTNNQYIETVNSSNRLLHQLGNIKYLHLLAVAADGIHKVPLAPSACAHYGFSPGGFSFLNSFGSGPIREFGIAVPDSPAGPTAPGHFFN